MTALNANPEPQPSRPIRRPAVGWSWIGLGYTFRAAGLAVAVFGLLQDWTDGYLWFAVAAAFGLGYWTVRRGKRLIATRADMLMSTDRRPPILYLRSFNDEDQDKGPSWFFRASSPAGRDLAYSTTAWGSREQDALSAIFSEVGPYIAIGEPRERVPELCAARMYLPGDEWQTKVRELAEQARLIIVRVGQSGGLRWEISELVRQGAPTKLLLVLPARLEDYVPFREWADQVLPVPLPQGGAQE
jgi:hypothetical protein